MESPDWGTCDELLNDIEAPVLWRPGSRRSTAVSARIADQADGSDPDPDSEGEEGDGDGEEKAEEEETELTQVVRLESRPFGFEVSAASSTGEGALVQQVDERGAAAEANVTPGSLIVSINEDSVGHLHNSAVKGRLETEPLPVLLGLQLPAAERKQSKARRRNPITLCTARCRGSYRVVREAIEWLGWREVATESRETSVVWLEHADPTSGLAPVQTLSRIDAFLSFCRKGRLAQCLNPWLEELPEEFVFWPKSWVLPYDAADLEAAMTRSKDTFIAKPSAGSQGKGIVLARRWRDLADIVQRSQAAASLGASKNASEYVVQRYIAKPLLVDGLKFDLRLYMVVTSVVPLRAYLFKEGLARFCTVPYQPPKEGNLQDACMHLTNFAVNAKSQSYQATEGILQHDEGSKRSASAVFRQIQQEHGASPETIWQQVAELAANTLQALRPGLVEHYAHELRMPLHPLGPKGFQIIGLDVLLDSELRPILLELNANPSLSVLQPGPREEEGEPSSASPAASPHPPPPAPPPQERAAGGPDVERQPSRGTSRPRSRGPAMRRGSSMRRESRQRLGTAEARGASKEGTGGHKSVTSELDLEIKRTLVCQALLLSKPASQAKVTRLRKHWRQEGLSSTEIVPLDDSGAWVPATRPSRAEKLCPDAAPELCPALEALDFASLSAPAVAEYSQAHLELYRCWCKACGQNQDSLGQAPLLKLLQSAGFMGTKSSTFTDRVTAQLWLTRAWREAADGGFGLTLPQFVAVAGRLGGMLLAGCTDSEPDADDRPSHIQGVQGFASQVLHKQSGE